MKKFFIILSLLVAAGCEAQYTQEYAPQRFVVVSRTNLTEIGAGQIFVIRDTLLDTCTANHLYGGVVSWKVPCDQAQIDEAIKAMSESMFGRQ